MLTTKSETFTAELLDDLGLQPWRLYGREAGAKPQVLLQLQRERPLRAFLEDRRATPETVRATPGLERLVCSSCELGLSQAIRQCWAAGWHPVATAGRSGGSLGALPDPLAYACTT